MIEPGDRVTSVQTTTQGAWYEERQGRCDFDTTRETEREREQDSHENTRYERGQEERKEEIK